MSIVNDTSGENHTGCNAVIEALLALCEAHGLTVIERLTRRQILDGQAPQRCALVIVNGEGSLHHNTSQAQFFPRLLERLDENSQPAVLINSVWDTPEFMNSMNCAAGVSDRHYWELMERWVRLVSLRESLSYEQYAAPADPALVPLRAALITPDLSFWALRSAGRPPAPQEGHAREDKFVGFSDSLPPDALAKLKAGGEPLLGLPLRPARAVDHFIAQLRHCKEYHTARFHGACLALMAGVPKIVTYPANCHKIDGLVADVERADGKFNYCRQAPDRIEQLMSRVALIARREAGL